MPKQIPLQKATKFPCILSNTRFFLTLYTVIAQQIFCLKIVIFRKTIQFQRVAKCHNDSPVLQLRNSTIIFALQFSQKFQGSYSEYAFPQDFCEVNVPSHTDSEFPK